MENFFSNEEIVLLFETNALAIMTIEEVIEHQEKKLAEVNKLSNNNPIAKAIANIVGNITGTSMEESLKAFKEGTSEVGKKYRLTKNIVKSLSLPYYAITGKTIEDVKEDFNKNHRGKHMDKIEEILKSLF